MNLISFGLQMSSHPLYAKVVCYLANKVFELNSQNIVVWDWNWMLVTSIKRGSKTKNFNLFKFWFYLEVFHIWGRKWISRHVPENLLDSAEQKYLCHISWNRLRQNRCRVLWWQIFLVWLTYDDLLWNRLDSPTSKGVNITVVNIIHQT